MMATVFDPYTGKYVESQPSVSWISGPPSEEKAKEIGYFGPAAEKPQEIMVAGIPVTVQSKAEKEAILAGAEQLFKEQPSAIIKEITPSAISYAIPKEDGTPITKWKQVPSETPEFVRGEELFLASIMPGALWSRETLEGVEYSLGMPREEIPGLKEKLTVPQPPIVLAQTISPMEKERYANWPPEPTIVERFGAGVIFGAGVGAATVLFPPVGLAIGGLTAWGVGTTIGTAAKERSIEPFIQVGKSLLQPESIGMLFGGVVGAKGAMWWKSQKPSLTMGDVEAYWQKKEMDIRIGVSKGEYYTELPTGPKITSEVKLGMRGKEQLLPMKTAFGEDILEVGARTLGKGTIKTTVEFPTWTKIFGFKKVIEYPPMDIESVGITSKGFYPSISAVKTDVISAVMKFTPEEYAEFLQTTGKIEYAPYARLSPEEEAQILWPTSTFTPKISISYELQGLASQREFAISHELAHYTQPRWLSTISKEVPYGLKPTELRANIIASIKDTWDVPTEILTTSRAGISRLPLEGGIGEVFKMKSVSGTKGITTEALGISEKIISIQDVYPTDVFRAQWGVESGRMKGTVSETVKVSDLTQIEPTKTFDIFTGAKLTKITPSIVQPPSLAPVVGPLHMGISKTIGGTAPISPSISFGALPSFFTRAGEGVSSMGIDIGKVEFPKISMTGMTSLVSQISPSKKTGQLSKPGYFEISPISEISTRTKERGLEISQISPIISGREKEGILPMISTDIFTGEREKLYTPSITSQIQITPTKQRLITPTQLITPTRSKIFELPTIIQSTPPPVVPPPTFFGWPSFGGFALPKFGKPFRKGKRETRYTPSIIGMLSGMKIPRAPKESLTGFEIRYPVGKKSKRKRDWFW